MRTRQKAGGATRADIHERVTAEIIKRLEEGVTPWTQGWTNQGTRPSMPLRHNGERYHGINVILLWITALEHGYASPHWMTYKQAEEYGGQVRKGEKGTTVVHAGTATRGSDNEQTPNDNDGKVETFPYLRSYSVFNAAQIDGLPEKFLITPEPGPMERAEQRIHEIDALFTATGADIRHGGDRAFYRPATDHIQMPLFNAFDSPENYYHTLAHELSHWTSHATRLDRSFDTKRFGDDGYAMEELVAEISAVFICAELGIGGDNIGNHASYLSAWLAILKSDKRAIFTAASYAQKAADFVHTAAARQAIAA